MGGEQVSDFMMQYYVDREKEILQEMTLYDLSDNDMSIIRRVLKNLKLADASDFWECMYIITNAFQEKQCQDINVISNVLKMACYRNYRDNFLGLSLTKDDNYFTNFMKEIDNVFPACLFVPYDHILSMKKIDYLKITVLCGEVKFLKLLLNFGANILFLPDTESKFFAENLVFLITMYDKTHLPRDYLDQLENSIHLKREEINRIDLVMMALRILAEILFFRHKAETVVRAARLLFKSLPFGHITSRETRMLLESLLADFPALNQWIEDIIKDYEHYFPESTDEHKARSLQDLCRCQVRESLRAAKTCWYGVPLLPLSNIVKKFLRFEAEEY